MDQRNHHHHDHADCDHDHGFEHDHDLKKVKATSKPLYRNLPVSFTCEHCDYTGFTIVEQKTTYISYILMVILIFLVGIFISIILMPLIILLTRSFFHKCPSCFKEVGSDNKILSILNMTDKVISFNIGEFGVVLTRKIVLGIFLTLVLFSIIFVNLSYLRHHHDGPIVTINESWENYLKDCGREAFYSTDILKSHENIIRCEGKYIGKTILEWRGFVIRVEDYRRSVYSFLHHAVVVLLKMVPSDSELYPDLVLAIDSERANEMNDLIISLNRGSEVIFNATIVSVGSDMKTAHMHLLSLAKGDSFMEVPQHINELGRYADKPRFFRNTLAADDEHK